MEDKRPKTAPSHGTKSTAGVHRNKKKGDDVVDLEINRKGSQKRLTKSLQPSTSSESSIDRVDIHYNQSYDHPVESTLSGKSREELRKEKKEQKKQEVERQKHICSAYQEIQQKSKHLCMKWKKEIEVVRYDKMMDTWNTIQNEIQKQQFAFREFLVKYELSDTTNPQSAVRQEIRVTKGGGEGKQSGSCSESQNIAEQQGSKENPIENRNDIEKLKEELDFSEAKNNSLEDKIKELETLLREKDEQLKQTSKPDFNRPVTAPVGRKDIEKVVQQYEERIIKLNSLLKEKEAESNKLEMEKNEAISRLSEIAGRRLRDNNPNVTDLSTQFRPIKIAEFYRELYDNQWTDAFFVFSEKKGCKENPEATIKKLLKTLRRAYSFCRQNCSRINEALTSYSTYIDTTKAETKTLQLTDECQSLVKQLRKSLASVLLPEIQEEFLRTFSETSELKEIKDYGLKCVEITWYMNVQTPPMVLVDIPEKGSGIDTALYSFYTVSGKYVDYVVWPACRFENGGNLLSKGVIQPIKENGSHKKTGSDDDKTKRKDEQPANVEQASCVTQF